MILAACAILPLLAVIGRHDRNTWTIPLIPVVILPLPAVAAAVAGVWPVHPVDMAAGAATGWLAWALVNSVPGRQARVMGEGDGWLLVAVGTMSGVQVFGLTLAAAAVLVFAAARMGGLRPGDAAPFGPSFCLASGIAILVLVLG